MRVSWGLDTVPLWGYGLCCGSISPGVMKHTKHLVLYRNWPIYPRTLIVPNYIPRWRVLSPVLSPDDKPRNLIKPWALSNQISKTFLDVLEEPIEPSATTAGCGVALQNIHLSHRVENIVAFASLSDRSLLKLKKKKPSRLCVRINVMLYGNRF